MDDLDKFVNWYLASGSPRSFNVPAQAPIMDIDGILGLTLFRFNEYQVQLFIAGPSVVVPPHSHPDIDSYEMAIFGVQLELNNIVKIPMARCMNAKPTQTPWEIPTAIDYGKRLRVRPGVLHGGLSSPLGGSFLSLQKWLNGGKPSSVAANWVGPTLGEKHNRHIKFPEFIGDPRLGDKRGRVKPQNVQLPPSPIPNSQQCPEGLVQKY